MGVPGERGLLTLMLMLSMPPTAMASVLMPHMAMDSVLMVMALPELLDTPPAPPMSPHPPMVLVRGLLMPSLRLMLTMVDMDMDVPMDMDMDMDMDTLWDTGDMDMGDFTDTVVDTTTVNL